MNTNRPTPFFVLMYVHFRPFGGSLAVGGVMSFAQTCTSWWCVVILLPPSCGFESQQVQRKRISLYWSSVMDVWSVCWSVWWSNCSPLSYGRSVCLLMSLCSSIPLSISLPAYILICLSVWLNNEWSRLLCVQARRLCGASPGCRPCPRRSVTTGRLLLPSAPARGNTASSSPTTPSTPTST